MSNDNAPFYIGQKVVCIDDKTFVPMKELKKGNEYIVLDLVNDMCGGGWMVGYSIDPQHRNTMPCSCGLHNQPAGNYRYCLAKRFAPIISDYTDATAEILEKFKPFDGIEIDQPVKQLQQAN